MWKDGILFILKPETELEKCKIWKLVLSNVYLESNLGVLEKHMLEYESQLSPVVLGKDGGRQQCDSVKPHIKI